WLMIVEHPSRAQTAVAAARRLVELEPECFRAYDALCEAGGVANGHAATTAGPEAFVGRLPASLRALPGLPGALRSALDHPEGGDPALYAVFEKAGAPGDDPGEPSWAAMGHLLRETRFVQVFRRLRFMRYDWSVPVDEYWEEARPSVVGHRFSPVLEMI